MANKNISPSKGSEYATIRLTSKQKKRVHKIIPGIFLQAKNYPANMVIIIDKSETLSNEAQTRIDGNTLKI